MLKGFYPITDTYCVSTPTGGFHLYFKYPEQFDHIKCIQRIEGYPGIELKADGGKITLCGSINNDGFYTKTNLYAPIEGIQPAPTWLIEIIKNNQIQKEEAPPIITDNKEAIGRNERNSTLTTIIGKWRRRGLSLKEIWPLAKKLNNERCQPPLAEQEVKIIVESVCKYSKGEYLYTDFGK